MTARETIDADEVAAMTGLSAWSIYNLVRRGEIPHIRVGRRVLFRRSSILNWLEEQEQATKRQRLGV
ncbi:MAG: helix-turn-helix domain-containing protein [Bacillota bacterium]|nr:helix-turn-helix domain-containing protein [Bacillota bacterium]